MNVNSAEVRPLLMCRRLNDTGMHTEGLNDEVWIVWTGLHHRPKALLLHLLINFWKIPISMVHTSIQVSRQSLTIHFVSNRVVHFI